MLFHYNFKKILQIESWVLVNRWIYYNLCILAIILYTGSYHQHQLSWSNQCTYYK